MADAHAAARDGDLEALNTFIAAGSNLNQRDKHSRTPLHLAAWAGKVSADMHVSSCSIFLPTLPWAATYWPLTCLLTMQAECVEALLKAGCDLKAVAQDETSALHFAAQTGRTDVCRILLNAGESHAACISNSCLQWRLALRKSAVRVCAGLKVNLRTRRGFTPLHNAAKGGEATSPFLPSTVKFKNCLQQPGSALTGHAATVALLLKRKATPSATNRNDQTPLSLATDDAVRALLQAAAAATPDPGPAPGHGATPVHPSAEADEAAVPPGDAGSKPKRERPRGRKRRGADEDLGDADGFQPWRAPQFDQLAAAEAAAAEHGGLSGRQASAAEAPIMAPVGPSEGRGALSGAPDGRRNPAGLQPAGGAPADAGAQRADAAGAAPATDTVTPAQDAPVVDETPQEAPSIGPAERPALAANGAGPGAGQGAGLGSATVRKRPRVALAHLGDEEEGGEEE